MKNILFVLYHDFTSNSAIHVHNFANQLAAFGHQVAVAIPEGKETAENLGERSYEVATFPEFDGRWDRFFPRGGEPDLVHAWTPRENVRLFCEKLALFAPFQLLVHLEDNEERILEANLGTPFAALAAMTDLQVPGNLSHPLNYQRFLRRAAGVTIIMDRLDKFVPPSVPRLVLWPGADRRLFYPRPIDQEFRASLGIPAHHLVLCYTGNVHSANAREVRSLYLAIAMLNREGHPSTLLRAGTDYCPFLGNDDTWARQFSVELGYVPHVDVPQLLAQADYMIQPGTDDAFNEFRLPAKLSEFFSMGRPVVLPRTNAGRFVEHGREAWVLPKVNAPGIVETLVRFAEDPKLVAQLSEGALAFSRTHFDWETNARSLENFYQNIPTRPPLSETHYAPLQKSG